ncbi:unnamed protein product [Trichogramma brassicae]|uniref:Uncharacterized protein n=1 Tax=Trichogramma brassicae TaxID=86971 RepID=A0A6H5IGE4_9HYME|nr:unnamed protein product [Trichogramma brassicae]
MPADTRCAVESGFDPHWANFRWRFFAWCGRARARGGACTTQKKDPGYVISLRSGKKLRSLCELEAKRITISRSPRRGLTRLAIDGAQHSYDEVRSENHTHKRAPDAGAKAPTARKMAPEARTTLTRRQQKKRMSFLIFASYNDRKKENSIFSSFLDVRLARETKPEDVPPKDLVPQVTVSAPDGSFQQQQVSPPSPTGLTTSKTSKINKSNEPKKRATRTTAKAASAENLCRLQSQEDRIESIKDMLTSIANQEDPGVAMYDYWSTRLQQFFQEFNEEHTKLEAGCPATLHDHAYFSQRPLLFSCDVHRETRHERSAAYGRLASGVLSYLIMNKSICTRSRRCSRSRDDENRFVYGRYRHPTRRSPFNSHQHPHAVHDDEGIYESADLERDPNARPETPDNHFLSART